MSRTVAFFGSILGFAPLTALAAPATIKEWIGTLVAQIQSVFPVLAALALVFFLWNMSKYVFNSDDTKARSEAREYIFWMTIAFFVMITLWGIVGVVRRTFF